MLLTLIKARGAGDGIKPGVERSETPGTVIEKRLKPAERPKEGIITMDGTRTAIGRFADSANS